MLTGPNLIVAACVLSGVIESSGLDHDFVSKVAILALPKCLIFLARLFIIAKLAKYKRGEPKVISPLWETTISYIPV